MSEYLDNFISFAKLNFQAKSMVIWDHEFKCIFASKLYLDYIGEADICGKKMFEVNQEFANLSIEFKHKITNRVLSSRKPVMGYFFYSNPKGQSYALMNATVYPIFDQQSNEIIAVLTEVNRIGNEEAYFALIKSFSTKDQNSVMSTTLNLNHKITLRERIIIFLLIIGRNHKQITQIIATIFNRAITVNTVSNAISKQIYRKLEVNNTPDLIHKAIRLGFLYNIPKELVSLIPRVLYVSDDVDDVSKLIQL